MPAAWVAGDEVYGADPKLRAKIRELGLGYVLNIAANRHLSTQAGRCHADAVRRDRAGLGVAALLGRPAAKARATTTGCGATPPEQTDDRGHHWLLAPQQLGTGELAYLRCYNPRRVALTTCCAWPDNAGVSRRTCAPRGVLSYPRRSRDELEGGSWV